MDTSIQLAPDIKLSSALENIKKSIVELQDIQELNSIQNMASGFEEAWRKYYRSSGFGFEQMFLGWETKIRSERRMGELLPKILHNGDSHDVTFLEDLGISKMQSHRYQRLSAIPEDKFDKRIEELRATFTEPTTSLFIKIITGAYGDQRLQQENPELYEQIKTGKISLEKAMDIIRIQANSTNEWNTPKNYIDAARSVLEDFDVDPASNAEANKLIQAKIFYTKETNGLDKKWQGKVWLNPPYGGIAADFTNKLMEEFASGNVTEAILLVNANSTDTKWFSPCWDHTLCFTNHRINFDSSTSQEGGSTHGSVFIYLGKNVDVFVQNFKRFGPIVQRIDT